MKRKRNSVWPTPEIEAVLKASPNLKPCKRKYGRVPYDQFLEHIRKDRCTQCRDFVLQLDKRTAYDGVPASAQELSGKTTITSRKCF